MGKTHANITNTQNSSACKGQRKLYYPNEAGNIKHHSNSIKYTQINEGIDIITREYIMGNKNVDEFLLGIAHN